DRVFHSRDLLHLVVERQVEGAGRKLRQHEFRFVRRFDQKRMRLGGTDLRAQVRAQVVAVDADAGRLADQDARRLDRLDRHHVGSKQEVRRIRERNQHEHDENDRRIDQVEAAEQPSPLIDNRHTSSRPLSGPRRTAASNDTNPSALIHPRYGATSARCRTSVPMLPLLSAMIPALTIVYPASTHVSSASRRKPATRPIGTSSTATSQTACSGMYRNSTPDAAF